MEFEKIDNTSYTTEDIKGKCLSSICKKQCNGATGNAITKVTNNS